MRAITVSEHQPGIIGDHMAREVGRHGEIEPVAMGTVLGPFTVSLKVKKAGLDLHDPDVSTGDRPTTSARLPFASESSVTTECPSARSARQTPRWISAVIA